VPEVSASRDWAVLSAEEDPGEEFPAPRHTLRGSLDHAGDDNSSIRSDSMFEHAVEPPSRRLPQTDFTAFAVRWLVYGMR
jgi:hypothetical protein